MSDPANDIDALAFFLEKVAEGDPMRCDPEDALPWSKALTALVAERNALKQRVAELTGDLNVLVADRSVSTERLDAAKKRIAELESHPPAASDLRERLVCAALAGLCADPRHDADEEVAVAIADRTLAAMRKGEA